MITYHSFELSRKARSQQDDEIYLDAVEELMREAIRRGRFVLEDDEHERDEDLLPFRPKIGFGTAELGYMVGRDEVCFDVGDKEDLDTHQIIPRIGANDLRRASKFGEKARTSDGKTRLTRQLAKKFMKFHRSSSCPMELRRDLIASFLDLPESMGKHVERGHQAEFSAEEIKQSLETGTCLEKLK